MKYHYLGRSGLKVSTLAYGSWLNAGTGDKGKLFADIVKKAYSLGVNFFDSAEYYGYGEAEKGLGAALKQLNVPREKYVVSTKLFFSQPKTTNPINDNGLSRKHVTEGIRNSLKRLDLDYVDIVFAHRYDYDLTLEEICSGFNDIVREKKALYWGTSNWPAPFAAAAVELCRARGWHAPVAEQCQYNMMHRQHVESEYIPLFMMYGYGTMLWSPLAAGLLSGRYNDGKNFEGRQNDDKSRWHEYTDESTIQETLKKLRGIDALAKRIGFTMPQLALAWTLVNSATSTCIMGADSVQQVEDNIACLKLVDQWKPEYEKELEQILGNTPHTLDNNKTDGQLYLNRERMVKYGKN